MDAWTTTQEQAAERVSAFRSASHLGKRRQLNQRDDAEHIASSLLGIAIEQERHPRMRHELSRVMQPLLDPLRVTQIRTQLRCLNDLRIARTRLMAVAAEM